MSKKIEDIALESFVSGNERTINAFKSDATWLDICRIIDDWIEGTLDDYESCSTVEELRSIQGVTKALRYVKNIPDAMLAILQAQEKVSK